MALVVTTPSTNGAQCSGSSSHFPGVGVRPRPRARLPARARPVQHARRGVGRVAARHERRVGRGEVPVLRQDAPASPSVRESQGALSAASSGTRKFIVIALKLQYSMVTEATATGAENHSSQSNAPSRGASSEQCWLLRGASRDTRGSRAASGYCRVYSCSCTGSQAC